MKTKKPGGCWRENPQFFAGDYSRPDVHSNAMACELRHSRERLKQWVQEGPLVGRMAYWWSFILLKRSYEIPKWSLTFVEAFVVIQLELVYHMSASQVPKLDLNWLYFA